MRLIYQINQSDAFDIYQINQSDAFDISDQPIRCILSEWDGSGSGSQSQISISLIGNSSYRLNFELGKKNNIHHHS
jgi:hypothetical protein